MLRASRVSSRRSPCWLIETQISGRCVSSPCCKSATHQARTVSCCCRAAPGATIPSCLRHKTRPPASMAFAQAAEERPSFLQSVSAPGLFDKLAPRRYLTRSILEWTVPTNCTWLREALISLLTGITSSLWLNRSSSVIGHIYNSDVVLRTLNSSI